MNQRTFVGFALGPAGVALLSGISLPIMAWIFPPDDIGKFSMLQVAINLSTVLCCLGLDQAYGREYHESNDHAALLLNTVLPGFVLLLIMLVILTLLNPEVISWLLYDTASISLSGGTALCLIAAYLLRFLSVMLRMQNRGFSYSFSKMLSKFVLLVIVLGCAFLYSSRSLVMLVIAQTIALIAALTVFAWITRNDWWYALRAKFAPTQVKRLLNFGFPLVLAGVSTWGVASLDRVFLRSMSTYDELAIYSVAASIAAGANILAGVLNTIWAPVVYKWVADNVDMDRIDIVAHSAAIIIFWAVCLAGCSSWILSILLPPIYGNVAFLVVGCVVAPLFYTLSEITGIGIAIVRRTIFSLAAAAAAVILDILLCIILIPHEGALGATVATACSFWVYFVLRTEFSVLVWRKLRRRKIHLYGILALILTLTYAAFGRYNSLASAGGWWIILAISIYIERKTLLMLWQRGCQYVWVAGNNERNLKL